MLQLKYTIPGEHCPFFTLFWYLTVKFMLSLPSVLVVTKSLTNPIGKVPSESFAVTLMPKGLLVQQTLGHHGAVARLKDVERQGRLRQQDQR